MSETYLLPILSLTSEGEGIGTLDGYKIFIEGVLPGETALISLIERRKNYGKGKLVNISNASPNRIQPICPIFGSCGGCQIMHLSYDQQLQAKTQRVKDAMQRIGRLETIPIAACIASPNSLHYRNKIQLPIRGKKIGLYQKGSHEIIPVEQCHIHCEEGEEILSKIKPLLNLSSLRFLIVKNSDTESLVLLVTDHTQPLEIKKLAKEIITLSPRIKGVIEVINQNDDNVILTSHIRILEGRSYIFEKLHDKSFRISASSFFQVNTAQAMNLISYCIKEAEIAPSDEVLDAYCGVGTFSLFAADAARFVYGTEISPTAIDDARANAKLNGIENVSFQAGDAKYLMSQIPEFDIAILNPPRKGCAPELIEQLQVRKPKKIVYISCDPATLARDISKLKQEYKIISVQPFDMFPQTMHVETVVVMVS